MKKTVKQFGIYLLMALWLISMATVSVSAAPEDYLNDIVDGISSAVERYWNSTEPPAEFPSEVTTDTATQPFLPTESYNIYPFDDNNDNNFYTEEPTEVPTETPTEEITEEITEETTFHFYDEPDENYYDYTYVPPTEEITEAYEPEILTETHTDPPFLERFAITDDGEGNVFIALGLWLSILSGIIIVFAVLIATHRRKKGK